MFVKDAPPSTARILQPVPAIPWPCPAAAHRTHHLGEHASLKVCSRALSRLHARRNVHQTPRVHDGERIAARRQRRKLQKTEIPANLASSKRAHPPLSRESPVGFARTRSDWLMLRPHGTALLIAHRGTLSNHLWTDRTTLGRRWRSNLPERKSGVIVVIAIGRFTCR